MKHIYHILYCLLVIAGLSSCITDTIYDNDCPDGGKANEDKAQVMLSLSVPSPQLPSATRAISNDSDIQSLHLLVFEDNVLTAITDITDKYRNANNGKFYVTVMESEKSVSMSIVANTEIRTKELMNNGKSAVLKALTFTNASALSAMPMYGATETFQGISRDKTYNVNVSLTRSLAKIEVQYNSTQSKEEFQFLGIEILNTNSAGYVATDQGSYAQGSVPSIYVAPISVEGLPIASAYVAETANNTSNKISVLVHGSYYGVDGYYRLDMIKAGEETEISQLVRNFKYVFSLQNVNFEGRTRDEALAGEPDNKAIKAVVMTLSGDKEEYSILDITTDDEFFLGVNSSRLKLQKDGNYIVTKLKILTNNLKYGWEIVDYPEGVSFTPGTTGGRDERKVETVYIYATIKTDFTFYISCGKIRKRITVEQP